MNRHHFESTTELKEDFPVIKIIVVSGGGTRAASIKDSGMRLAMEASIGLGADYALQRPGSRQQILQVIEEALHDSRV